MPFPNADPVNIGMRKTAEVSETAEVHTCNGNAAAKDSKGRHRIAEDKDSCDDDHDL